MNAPVCADTSSMNSSKGMRGAPPQSDPGRRGLHRDEDPCVLLRAGRGTGGYQLPSCDAGDRPPFGKPRAMRDPHDHPIVCVLLEPRGNALTVVLLGRTYPEVMPPEPVGGPFVTRKAAEDHRSTYIPAAHRHSEEMLGLTLPAASYSVVEGCNLVEALCAALELPGHHSSRDDVTPNEPRSSSKLQENSSSLPDTSLSTKLR
jgi:hypothetical protein